MSTQASIDINVYDGTVYGDGEHYAHTALVAYPIRNGQTDTMGEPLMKVVIPGDPEVDDTWIQNIDQERPVFEDSRINAALDFMFSILA